MKKGGRGVGAGVRVIFIFIFGCLVCWLVGWFVFVVVRCLKLGAVKHDRYYIVFSPICVN